MFYVSVISSEQKLTNEQRIPGLGKFERMCGVGLGVESAKWCSCEISIQWNRTVDKVRKGGRGTGAVWNVIVILVYVVCYGLAIGRWVEMGGVVYGLEYMEKSLILVRHPCVEHTLN